MTLQCVPRVLDVITDSSMFAVTLLAVQNATSRRWGAGSAAPEEGGGLLRARAAAETDKSLCADFASPAPARDQRCLSWVWRRPRGRSPAGRGPGLCGRRPPVPAAKPTAPAFSEAAAARAGALQAAHSGRKPGYLLNNVRLMLDRTLV